MVTRSIGATVDAESASVMGRADLVRHLTRALADARTASDGMPHGGSARPGFPGVVLWGSPGMGLTSVADAVVSSAGLGPAYRLGLAPAGHVEHPDRPGHLDALAAEIVDCDPAVLVVERCAGLDPAVVRLLYDRITPRGCRPVVLAVAHRVTEPTATLPLAHALGRVTWVPVDPLPGATILALVAREWGQDIAPAHRSVLTAVCAGRPGLAVAIGRQLAAMPGVAEDHAALRAACSHALGALAGPWLDALPAEVGDLGLLAALIRPDADLAAAGALLGLAGPAYAVAKTALHALGLDPSAPVVQDVVYRTLLTWAPPPRLEAAATLAVTLLERLSACPSRRLSLMSFAGVRDERYAAAARLAVHEAQLTGALDSAREVVQEALVRCPSPATAAWANQAFLQMAWADRWDAASVALVRSAANETPVGAARVTDIPIAFGLESPEAMAVALDHTPRLDSAADRCARVTRAVIAGLPPERTDLGRALRDASTSRPRSLVDSDSIDAAVCRVAVTTARGGAAEAPTERLLRSIRDAGGLLSTTPRTAALVAFSLLGQADYEHSLQWSTVAAMSGPRAEVPDLALSHTLAAHALLRLGQTERARSEALKASSLFDRIGATTLSAVARATAIHADIEAGISTDRDVAADHGRMHPLLRAYLVYVQARVELARGRVDLATPLLLETGRVLGSAGLVNPILLNWRPHLAAVFRAAGQSRLADTVTAELTDAFARWARTNPLAARRRAPALGITLTSEGPWASPDERISEAERRVIDLVVAGKSSESVARALFLSKRTVDTHLNRVYRRLGVHSREELRAALTPRGTLPTHAVYG